MKNRIEYEWCIETIDENENIIDSSFYDSFSELPTPEENQRICLVRNEGNDIDGLTDRYWAYLVGGKLPANFTNDDDCEVSIKVPKKFHKQVK